MDTGTFGAWIPVWILGAPLALAVLEWLRTPKPREHASGYRADGRPMTPGMAGATAGSRA